MTMTHFNSLSDHDAEALRGGNWCMPKSCSPKLPCMPKLPTPCLPVIKLPEIYIPKISIDWGKCNPKPSPC